MSLIDLITIPAGEAFNADVVIVGAGVAGLVLADALRGSGMSVDVLEAGGASLEQESQALYEAEMVGVPHLGTNEGRFRVYGGSSIRWGGATSTPEAIRFQSKAAYPIQWLAYKF